MTVDLVSFGDWAGSIAAALSIVALLRKSLFYWYLSIVATTLWFFVFLATDTAMAAGLQLSYTLFALYGIARWRLEQRRRPVPRRLDDVGALISLGIFAATIALSDFDGWLSWVELSAVALSLIANWLTAHKVVWCWPVWISTNVLFAILFRELGLEGLFAMQFVYAALSVFGWRAWVADGTRATVEPARA